jgi:hypothetical protein
MGGRKQGWCKDGKTYMMVLHENPSIKHQLQRRPNSAFPTFARATLSRQAATSLLREHVIGRPSSNAMLNTLSTATNVCIVGFHAQGK